MSALTVFLRSHGLGGVLDVIEGAEKMVGIPTSTAESQALIAKAVDVVKSGVATTVEHDIATVGASVASVVQGVVTKYFPSLATISATMEANILAEVEAAVAKALGAPQP